MRLDLLGLFLIGGIVAGLATLSVQAATNASSRGAVRAGGAPGEPPSTTAPRPRGTASDDCPQGAILEAEVRAARVALSGARARVGTLHEERTAIAGAPLEWDAFPTDHASPEQVTERLQAAAAAAGGTVLGTECEEPPCTFIVERIISGDVDFNEAQDAFLDTMRQELGPLRMRYGSSLSIDEETGDLTLQFFGDIWEEAAPNPAADHPDRLGFRTDALVRMIEE